MKSKVFCSDNKKSEMNIQKETVFKKLLRVFKHPAFAVISLLLAVICFVVCSILPKYSYNQSNGNIRFENPESFDTSDSGWKAIVDDHDSIYCLNENEELVYAVDISQFPYENTEIIDITFRSDNHLYCHIAVYNPTAYLTELEAVLEIDTTGNILREILHYDYSKTDNPPSHQVRICGLHFYGEKLYYLYKEDNGCTLMEVNPDNPQQTKQVFLANEGYVEIIQCHSSPDGTFLILKNNGEIGYISLDSEYQLIYKATYDARKAEGIFPYDVFMIDSELYMLAEQEELALYKWHKDDWSLILPVKSSIQLPEDTNLFSYGLGEQENELIFHINESLYVLTDENTITPYCVDFSLPFVIAFGMWLQDVLPLIGAFLLLLGIISGIGNLMKWRLSILSKQLLSTIPLVFVLLIVVIISMFISMINLNTEDIIQETIAINEIAAAQFDGEELENITSFENVDNGQVKALSNQLREFINGNQSYWSHNYNMAIYVRTTGEKFVCIATSDGSGQFMVSSLSTDYPIDQEFYENSHTLIASVGYGNMQENLHLVLATPIYRTDGSYNAIILLTTSQNRLIQEILATGKRLLLYITLFAALLILVITLVSAYNAQSLKQAQNVISQIAGGDFSIRIDKHSKDEVGEICIGVNNMADRLEEYFNEKNRNEQFYYKFVPEKFRELLHKEKFTDLALGDAQSEDLSILFCDIRGFSLNSEMMTATESFDFVNRIYGKAGPIIRKHNGFIDKYIGDAIMALFESAEDAVAAGIELYQAIVLNPNAKNDFGIPSVKVGIGIHSGMARIGIVGENERMSGTVISNTVNLSSRMESLTKKYGVAMIISKDTLDRMENPDALSTRYLGMVQVAGVNEVAALYEVLDCLEIEQRKKREQTKMIFREAVRLFHTGELQQALEIFQKLTEQDKEDKAPQLYAWYIKDKLLRGDTEHNVFHFDNKE